MYKIYPDISAAVDQIEKRLIRVRRHLHRHPELGRVEFKTSRCLRNILQKETELDIHRVGETGFYADLVTGKKNSWLALRADMDALPIPDEKNVPYKSRYPGLCHACGHDFHSTIVLGVALTMQKFRSNIRDNIRFIFQHAEEPIPGGAIDFVKCGHLDNIDAIIGMHADPSLPYGKIGLAPGWITAQSIHFNLSIKGFGGHTGRPNEAADPVFTGIMILSNLYAELYRRLNSNMPFVFTVGKIAGGDSYNSIAQNFVAEGTLRVTDGKQGDALLKLIEQKVSASCANVGLISDFHFTKGASPVVNDMKLTEKVRMALMQILMPDQIAAAARSMGGEDFSAFLEKAPGVFLRVGVGNGKSSAPVHSGIFDIDERTITFAVKVFSWLLLQNLANKKR